VVLHENGRLFVASIKCAAAGEVDCAEFHGLGIV
jgi:hypothetical protein